MKAKRKADGGLTVQATLIWLAVRLLTMIKVLGSFILTIISAISYFVMGPLNKFLQDASHFWWLIRTTGDRDLNALKCFLKIKYFMWNCRRHHETLDLLFEKAVDEHPDKLCFVTHETKWTFKQADEYANRIANCFSELGFMPGEDVALFMENSPEYLSIMLGFAKLGVVPALVNTNQRQKQLIHSMTVVPAKAIIFSAELLPAIKDILDELREKTNAQLFCVGDFDASLLPAKSLDVLLQEASSQRPPRRQKRKLTDRLFYIYTSGTTGLPKAAIITHIRYMWMGSAMHFMIRITGDDVMYTCLPLYHSAAGILASCQCLIFGSTLAMRKKFSASKFWEDCKDFNVTVTHYIGELCRYLLAQPERPVDKEHIVRTMFGNGLRPQIWSDFIKRFNIQHIGELYGSTEGNTNVMNTDNKVGAVGFMSLIAPSVYPVALIKVDPVTGEPVRGSDGLCIRCGPGEPGEFVGKIHSTDPIKAFDGYVSKSATQKKVCKDVFKKGDCVFLSGDLLVMDKKGYLYFLDRTGDTFRWKGENVSTSEIESIISQAVQLADCVVYGVTIPGTEGKAGMAALALPPSSVDLVKLLKDLKGLLPAYSIPIFIRFIKEFDSTGTYKLRKVDLQKEGFDPSQVTDQMFYLNAKEGAYLPVDQEVYDSIKDGKIRF